MPTDFIDDKLTVTASAKPLPEPILVRMHDTGGNRTMVATIVSMATADGERISIFPLVCLNKARCVSFSASDI